MPPPKNGSLGRGLGDLLGGVPESIGVAGVPQAPAEKPAAVVETPPEPVVAPPCWKPSRVMLVFLFSLLLVLTGVVIGLRVVQLRAPQDPAE